jgi:tetratricopeptide (TPR) repeat protein
MTHTKEWYEEAAKVENQHVRAVILKKDHLEHGRAFELASRAYEMAGRALGEQHPAYAVALQNIGLYFCVIGSDTITAADYFDRAREVAGPYHAALWETFYWLGVFYYESRDASRAAEFFEEALTVQRHNLESKNPELAQTLIGLAYAKSVTQGPGTAVSLLQEALGIQEASLPVESAELRDTRRRLEEMQERQQRTSAE